MISVFAAVKQTAAVAALAKAQCRGQPYYIAPCYGFDEALWHLPVPVLLALVRLEAVLGMFVN